MPSETRMPVVFVVDDDDSVRKSLGRLLRTAGFDVRLYAEPERFLAEVTPTPSACIILDLTLPRVDGLTIASRLQRRGIVIPIIVLTAREDAVTRRAALESGATWFFQKPVQDRLLIEAVEQAIGPRPGRTPAQGRPDASAGTADGVGSDT